MGVKDATLDVVCRGDICNYIKPGTYLFFQRLKEHGGGYWLGQGYDDWFGFVIERTASLREGMILLLTIKPLTVSEKYN